MVPIHQPPVRRNQLLRAVETRAPTTAEILRYDPQERDQLVMTSWLRGHQSREAVLKDTGLSEEDYDAVVENPLALGWIATYLHAQVEVQLGLADVAMLHKARSGDSNAYRALCERYGAMAPKKSFKVEAKTELHQPRGVLQNMSDEELDRRLAAIQKKRSGK